MDEPPAHFSDPNSQRAPNPGKPVRPSLEEVHASVQVPAQAGFLRKLLAFAGPGGLVAVGYMDPGNWATCIAGGSRFGYTLLGTVFLSNLMAILLQALSLRLGIATGRDLAQTCRENYPRPLGYVLWALAELAIIACDLAEIIGSALALKLLFQIPLAAGALLTVLDAALVLELMRRGVRWLEAFIASLIVLIGGCLAVQVALAKPELGALLTGFSDPLAPVHNPEMLYLAIGILGATVMPHNLYLHSSLVQTRAIEPSVEGRRQAIRFATWDSTLSLGMALFVNAAILVLSAAAFHSKGRTDVVEIDQAHQLLAPLLGSPLAAVLFGVALLASGLNSTVTGTLAGQIVMEGFLELKLRPWARRLLTRGLAVTPVLAVIWLRGEQATGSLLVLSQVVLSMQLPFAVVPLVQFVSSRRVSGELRIAWWISTLAWAVAALIIALNLRLLWDTLGPKG